MANISPFEALRPQPQLAKQVASKPYDVLNSAEAKIEAQGNAHSFLHITKSEIDLVDTIDIHSEEVYALAAANLKTFIQRDILFKESKPCYYIYQLVMQERAQTGLVCVSSIDDYNNDIIKKYSKDITITTIPCETTTIKLYIVILMCISIFNYI